MPVIVVGADTDLGAAIVDALLPQAAELRAFVSDVRAAQRLKARGVKVAIGDVSDDTHVGGAALDTFCAILVADAAADERERSFASSPGEVASAWAAALDAAGTKRAIWVGDAATETETLRSAMGEFSLVEVRDRAVEDIVAETVAIESAGELPGA